MRKIIISILIGLISMSAHAEKYGTAASETSSLKKFGDTYSKLQSTHEDLESLAKSIKVNTKGDVSKYSFVRNDMLKPIDIQAQHVIHLYWSMNLALDIQNRNPAKMVSAFSGICTSSNTGFETERFFNDWKRVMIETAKEESFESNELSSIKNALDIFGESLKSTHDFCKRAQNPNNW